ncbi:VWA domain-containing protein [Demequina sp. SYSU T00039]|uniref:VWA domain-containing protein n=1 Tax=Demequina lignilytica TaxID=3051663 RepID=A0AAW7M6H9_9MICO|nr:MULTISPECIES: VWA domain-containing protein [unclassified Demequina]MDN4486618.1 VWA domain-containing protein [Demequina sp. SYSU T00039]MDN4489304.1 VWA domain-containing protein [Demequina sp. SYSU T00068]
MSFLAPLWIVAAAVVAGAFAVALVLVERRRREVLAASGLVVRRGGGRTVAIALAIAGIALLLVAAARPQAVVTIPRAAGTVVVAVDTSASMTAEDVDPTRLAAAQAAAVSFIEAQPTTVDIGVVSFAEGALATQTPSEDHLAAEEAVDSLSATGATSLGQAILAALSAITGETVTLDGATESGESGTETTATAASTGTAASTSETDDPGYWGDATIVLISDGEDTAGPDALAAAELASSLGVHIETIGVGTAAGTTLEVDGYTVTTALDEALLTQVAETTGGSYHELADASEVDDVAAGLDLRVTAQTEETEVTALVAGAALVVLLVGGSLMIIRTGRPL